MDDSESNLLAGSYPQRPRELRNSGQRACNKLQYRSPILLGYHVNYRNMPQSAAVPISSGHWPPHTPAGSKAS